MARYRDWLIGRWVGLMLVFVFVGALLLPTGAAARVEYTNDTSAAEGDPIDGLGSGGGTDDGGDLGDGDLGVPSPDGVVYTLPVFIAGPYMWSFESFYVSDFGWDSLRKMSNWRVK